MAIINNINTDKTPRLKHFFFAGWNGFQWGITCCIIMLLLLVASPYLLTKSAIASYIVTTGSMEPTVPVGSVALINPNFKINQGDIIAFASPTKADVTILHRVASISTIDNKKVFVTKGDNNKNRDNWEIEERAIKGKLMLWIPYVGHAAILIHTPLGFALILGLPLLYFAWIYIQMIIQGVSEEKQKKNRSSVLLKNILMGIMVLGVVFSFAFREAKAQFLSQAGINGITISAASTFATPTPTPSTTPGIIISGNGDGSQNTISVDSSHTTSVNQSNDTTITISTSNSANSGDNTVNGNTGNTTNVLAGDAILTTSITMTAATNSAQLQE